MKHLWKRLTALVLTLALCLAPAASALTPDQLKELLQEYYIDEVPQAALEAETVEDILAALGDPYTMYMTPEEFREFQATMEDTTVVGIGITALADPLGLLIVGTYAGTPAEALGLVAGDIITAVDGHAAAGQAAEIISGWLKGEEGTEVTFTVLHADGSTQDYTARRAKVTIPATTVEALEEDGSLVYINCTTFGPDTLGHFTQGTEAYDDANLWLVDMRSNGGGDVYAVTQTLGVFLGKGTMVYLRDGDDDFYRYVSDQESTTIYPVITLTSPQTASSAEIFSLAVKDKNGGMVIGSHTYGKGVAQVILTEDQHPDALAGDALRITTYQYYGTAGNTAQNIGVVPDLLVAPDDADEIATLFQTGEPADSTGWLRVHLGGWRWYIDLSQACSEQLAPYFGEMLGAMAPGAVILKGTGSGWEETTAWEVALENQVPNYTRRMFSDVSGHDCEHAANTLRTFEMLLGYEDKTFRPDNSLTRAELCALLGQAMGLRVAEGISFTDVPEEAWFAPYVHAAVAAGYMKGVGNGCFAPQDTVTNQELITVLGRVAAALNMNFYRASKAAPAPEVMGVPADYSAWAQPWAWLLAKSQTNILGQPLTMLPQDLEDLPARAPTTRGTMAQVLYTILNATEVINY